MLFFSIFILFFIGYNIIDIKNDVLVDGIDEIKVSLASCCNPIKGDSIVGYISRGNGVIVHNKKCHNIALLDERLIDVKWNKKIDKKFYKKHLTNSQKT